MPKSVKVVNFQEYRKDNIMSGFEGIGAVIGIIIVLANILESLVEAIFGMWIDFFPVMKPYKTPTLKTIAWLLGVGVAFGFQLDLMGYIAATIASVTGQGFTISAPSWLLYLLTGLTMGQGSSYIHQLLDRIAPQSSDRLGEL